MPASRPVVDASELVFVGLDVGGTNIKIGIVDDSGKPIASSKIPTQQHEGPLKAANRMHRAIESLAGDHGIAAERIAQIGLATPGPMDIPSGMLLMPGNLPSWHNTPIRNIVAEATGRPVTFANDANAAAFGEFWIGAGQQYHSMVLITLGTGVGGGIIVHDRLLVGAHSCGGEVGHNVLVPDDDAPASTAGVTGAIEAYCGSYGVLRRAHEAIAVAGSTSSLAQHLANDEDLTPLAIALAAENGDEVALKIVMDTARLLAISLVTIVHTIDPESIVIGGAMTFGGAGHPLGEQFIQAIRDHLNARILESLRGKIEVGFAQLGSDAGFIGAAGLARQDYLDG
jgi:glucokinase